MENGRKQSAVQTECESRRFTDEKAMTALKDNSNGNFGTGNGRRIGETVKREKGLKAIRNPPIHQSQTMPSSSANLQCQRDKENFCSVSNKKFMTEEDDPDFQESYLHRPEEKKVDDDAPILFRNGTTNGEKIKEMKDDDNAKPKVTERCFEEFVFFCSIFPLDYEFTKDILVWQWIAGGLVDLGEDAKDEEVFDKLLKMDYIVPSGHDYFADDIKYKFGEAMTTCLQTQKQPLEPKFAKKLEDKESDRDKVEHLSLNFKKIDCVKLDQVLKQYSALKTLIVHNCYEVDRLPSGLFLCLKTLKILNLSHAHIRELPSSFETLKDLRILDVSGTPIGWLPETLCCFIHLHTLNLDGCLQLEGLPKGTSKLTNLRHLILDVVRVLFSMPIGIGKLSNLQTLSAFLVDEDNGVRELKNMNKLRGSFRLLNLENVRTKEEGSEACLRNKVGLRKIELQWSDLQDKKNPCEEEIIESLRPPNRIEELKILFYSGGVLPSWICDPSFSVLVNVILYKCRYCCRLPSLGELPSLKRLSIIENNEVVEIDSSFFGKRTKQHPVAFPKLEKLSLDSMSKLEKWTGLKNGDFPSLRHLMIEYCPSFVGIPFLSHLNSLLHLEISYCPEFSCLSKGGHPPPSLESLMIKESPKLKDQCCDQQWEDWHTIAGVPTLYIDNDQKVFHK